MKKNKTKVFNYESKPFGLVVPTLAPWYFQSLKLEYCLDALPGLKGRILEVGCGGGGMSKAIKKYRPDLEVYGCDICQKSLKIAGKEDMRVNFVYCDARKLPFKDGSFDAVLMFDFLEHFESPRLVLAEAFRVLKRGGVLHAANPFEGDVLTIHGILLRFGWKVKKRLCGHLEFFSYGEPERLMEEVGFKVLDGPWSGHFLYQLADVCYFSLLAFLGRNAPFQVEGYIEFAKPGIKRGVISLVKNLIAIFSFFESKILFFLPGGFRHITALKQK